MPPCHGKASSSPDLADLGGTTNLGRSTPLRAESAIGNSAGQRPGDLISYQNDGKYSTVDFRKGEIVSEYSNAWIDMRHDNALNSAI